MQTSHGQSEAEGSASTMRPPDRIPGLEVLRILATLAIVLTHAAIAYMTAQPQGLAWPIHDAGDNSGFAARLPALVFVWGRSAGVAAFFAMAGFFAARSCERAGAGAMLRDRWRRVGRPLVWGTLIVLPLCYLVWCWGWWRTGYIQVEQMVRFRLSTQDKERLLGFAHLWYLEYLLIYAVVIWGWRRWRPRLPIPRLPPAAMLLVCSALMCLCLWPDPGLLLDFVNGFVPRWEWLLFNGVIFFAGVWLAGQELRRGWGSAFIAAQAMFVAWAMWGDGNRWWVLALVPFTLLSGMGAVAICACWKNTSRVIPHLAAPSFTIYLWHLPAVAAVTVALWGMAASPLVKLPIAAIVGAGLPWLGWCVWKQCRTKSAASNKIL